MDEVSISFLAEPAGRGMTVVVIGHAVPDLTTRLQTATGSTGVVIQVVSTAGPALDGEAVRAVATAVPVRSHVADLVVLAHPGAGDEIDAVAEESRRVLAPGGTLRALAPLEAAYRLHGELHAAGFRDATAQPLGSEHGIRARGP